MRKIEYVSSPCGTYSLVGEREGFHGGSDGKESAYNVGSLGWKDSLEEGTATLFSIFARKIPMNRGAWQAAVLILGLREIQPFWFNFYVLMSEF